MYQESKRNLYRIIGASSAGTLIEWYDFFIFGSLATILADRFYPSDDPTVGLLSTLATFATGFVVRPFGALVFGRIGDVVGRKYAFLATLLLMGGSTFAIGLLPTYDQIGAFAPILLILLRLVQGLALGGEYGGAATYVAEHAPDGQRGYYTSFIQTTATLGLFVSLGVILACRTRLSVAEFEQWGWRIPFLLSIVLVYFSYWLRRTLEESPIFQRMKASGKSSTSPLRDSFMEPANRRLVLLALFGATAGQGVVWYTGQFYALYFLQNELKVEYVLSNQIIAVALLIGTPFFIVMGWLSDKIGRKPLIVLGCAAGACSYPFIYRAMTAAVVDGQPQFAVLVGWIALQVLFVTMVYGPIAAFLVELFPTRIRYTSMSLPYHIGNGVFGGLVPFISTYLVGLTGDRYAGLWYPMAVAAMTAIIAIFCIKERRNVVLADIA